MVVRPGAITQSSSDNRLAHNELCQNKKSDYSVGPRKSLAGKDGTTVYGDEGVVSRARRLEQESSRK